MCDIELETDDGAVVYAHKVVLATASPYFHTMFTALFQERDKSRVKLRELDSVALRLSVEFIYTARIAITDDNAKVLLFAASLLQLQDVLEACCNFLTSQLNPLNCISTNALADLHGCQELHSTSDLYIRDHFSEVAVGEEFLSLSAEQVIKLISNDELTVPSEEKVFESVICWVNQNSDSRKQMLPELLAHVRLPLVPREYLITIVNEEPLLENSVACKNYIIEALNFQLLQYEQTWNISKTKRVKPRHAVNLHEVILVVGEVFDELINIEWYDPETDQWISLPEMRYCIISAGMVVLKDRVIAVGGETKSKIVCTVKMLDLSSPKPCWKPTVKMLVKRCNAGVAILNNCIYVVGGHDDRTTLKSAEMFNCNTQEWRMISNMRTRRSLVGVGVLNNLLYVVGGHHHGTITDLKSVECYDHITDTWTLLAEMSTPRRELGVGVLNGVLYAVGGENEYDVLKSVEAYRPCARVWTSVADMHVCRKNAGVVALNGLLYVVGGNDGDTDLDSVEMFDPYTNTWSMLTATMNNDLSVAGIAVIDRPSYFNI